MVLHMTRYSLFSFLFGFTALFAITISPQVNAQTEDLTLPGDEAPVVVNTGGANAETEGGAVRKKETLIKLILDGGWAMIPLFIMLFAVIGLSVFLFLDLKKKTFYPEPLVNSLIAGADAGDLNSISEQSSASSSCLGQVMNGACNYIYDRGYQVLDGDTLYDQMADATQQFNRRRVSLLNYLSVISQAAPMVGLLGTVSGMIKAFATLQQKGMGDPGQLAGHISEALVTTASGLIIALPAIFAFYFFRDKMIALVAEVDRHCSRVLNRLRLAVVGGPSASQSSSPAAPHPPASDLAPHPPASNVAPHPPQQQPPPNDVNPHPPQG